jgi:hypothetical protein
MTQLLQLKRTCSYPPQENINNNNNTVNSNKSLPITPCRSVNNTSTNSDTVQLRQVYPLTEENLALHTKNVTYFIIMSWIK